MKFQTRYSNKYNVSIEKDRNLDLKHCELFEDSPVMTVGDQVARLCQGYIPLSSYKPEDLPIPDSIDDPDDACTISDDPDADHIDIEKMVENLVKKRVSKSNKSSVSKENVNTDSTSSESADKPTPKQNDENIK